MAAVMPAVIDAVGCSPLSFIQVATLTHLCAPAQQRRKHTGGSAILKQSVFGRLRKELCLVTVKKNVQPPARVVLARV